jgi:hypothetical protein
LGGGADGEEVAVGEVPGDGVEDGGGVGGAELAEEVEGGGCWLRGVPVGEAGVFGDEQGGRVEPGGVEDGGEGGEGSLGVAGLEAGGYLQGEDAVAHGFVERATGAARVVRQAGPG